MPRQNVEVRPISGALGAELEGVDLSRDLDNETFASIHKAFLDHSVIFLRDQHLTTEQQKRFARRFGTLNIHPYVSGSPQDPELIEIIKEKDETYNFGGNWHSDLTCLEVPPMGSVLYAREVPAFGGDTLWSSMYLAYETLSPGMKRMLDGMVAVHSPEKPYGLEAAQRGFKRDLKAMKVRLSDEAAAAEVEHPVVRTHPETGRKALFINRTFTVRFKGMTEEESKPLIDYLCAHAIRPEFQCRFRWQANSLAFWDNRCTLHYALNDYHGQRRHMWRVTIDGTRPF